MYKYLLAAKYLLSRPINLIGTVGITVAVWAFILVVAIFTGYIGEMHRYVRGTAADLSLLAPRRDSWDDLEPLLRSTPGVEAVAPRLSWYGMVDPEHEKRRPPGTIDPAEAAGKPASNFYQVIGIDAAAEMGLRDFRAELEDVPATEAARRVLDPGQPFRVETAPGEEPLPGMVIGLGRAEEEMLDLERGDVLVLTTAKNAPPRAREPVVTINRRFRVSGVFSSRYFEYESSTVFVDIDEMRKMFPAPGDGPADVFNEVAIRIEDPSRATEVRNRLDERIRRAGFTDCTVHTWGERQRFARFLENVENQRGLMRMVLFVLMLVACFLVFATLLMMVAEKTRDVGILASLGAPRRGILAIFLLSGLVISAVGTVLGTLASWVTCIHINDINDWITTTFGIVLFPKNIYGLDEVPYELDPLWIGLVATLAIGLTLVFSLVPAWIAARMDPVQALRRE